MATHQVFIQGWRPINLNTMFMNHWTVRNKKKKADAWAIHVVCKNLPKATTKRLVSIHIVLTGKQKPTDPDAYWKSLLDGLVKCGMLIDDSDKYCAYSMPTFSKGTKEQAGTYITLEDAA